MTTVEALHVTPQHIYFKCPWCWENKQKTKWWDTNVKKGRVLTSMRPKIHRHTNELGGPRAIGDSTHRSHHNAPNSVAQRADKVICKGVTIEFTESTTGLVYRPFVDE